MRVIVAGPRDLYNYDLVARAIDRSWFSPTLIVSGGASGVDTMAIAFAQIRKIPVKVYRVTKEEWDDQGPSAGWLRNCKMAANADGLVAIVDAKAMNALAMDFPGSGTALMIRAARKHALKIRIYQDGGNGAPIDVQMPEPRSPEYNPIRGRKAAV